jgi:RNA polymerase sigma-54 factor
MAYLGLEQRQQQHLSLECKQGIQLLALSSVELDEYLRDCLQSNPFLKEDERQNRKQPLEASTNQYVSVEGLRDQRGQGWARQKQQVQRLERDSEGYRQAIQQQQGLYDYLETQAKQVLSAAEDIRIADYLIGNIDANGYLRCTVAEVAMACSCETATVMRVLTTLRRNVVPGIAARNLRECLYLQLLSKDRWLKALRALSTDAAWAAKMNTITLAKSIVATHLEDLAHGRLKKIAVALDTNVEAIQQAVDLLRSLDPKPGGRFSTDVELQVWPEVVVERDAGGDLAVRLCRFDLPELTVDNLYFETLREQKLNSEARRYINSEYKAAVGLLRAIDLRLHSIRSIASAIVARQLPFFSYGQLYLLPLTMATIAADTGLSESTVSRVVNGRYIQTPQGLFEMRFFFSAALTGLDAVEHSQGAALCAIRQLIADEDPHDPLSDSELAIRLKQQFKFDISRRTVNKYRGKLGIPTHTLRRRRA